MAGWRSGTQRRLLCLLSLCLGAGAGVGVRAVQAVRLCPCFLESKAEHLGQAKARFRNGRTSTVVALSGVPRALRNLCCLCLGLLLGFEVCLDARQRLMAGWRASPVLTRAAVFWLEASAGPEDISLSPIYLQPPSSRLAFARPRCGPCCVRKTSLLKIGGGFCEEARQRSRGSCVRAMWRDGTREHGRLGEGRDAGLG